MLRGSRDFESRQDYKAFLKKIFLQLNSGRMERFQKELRELKPLPLRRCVPAALYGYTIMSIQCTAV